ncbi:hypothetical protein QZH41_005981 [Actinostola sp. cb2023]|nr:hypothetical protein QZH41_005981 [Actinostola sp. cb2023]
MADPPESSLPPMVLEKLRELSTELAEGDITQKGYEKKKSRLLAPYIQTRESKVVSKTSVTSSGPITVTEQYSNANSVSSQDSYNFPVADYTPPPSPHIDKSYTEEFPAPPPEISNVHYKKQDSSGGITPPPDVTRKTSDSKPPTRVAHVQSLRIADEDTDLASLVPQQLEEECCHCQDLVME